MHSKQESPQRERDPQTHYSKSAESQRQKNILKSATGKFILRSSGTRLPQGPQTQQAEESQV